MAPELTDRTLQRAHMALRQRAIELEAHSERARSCSWNASADELDAERQEDVRAANELEKALLRREAADWKETVGYLTGNGSD